MSRCFALGAFACLLSLASAAQETSASPSGTAAQPAQAPVQEQPSITEQSTSAAQQPGQPASPQATSDKNKIGQNAKGTSNDRLFYALPNFLSVESAGKLPPLTTKEKFAVVTRGSFDYTQVPWYGFLSAISQAENSEPGFGQGWGGYGKRFAASFSDGTIENYITGAILPSMLHQDPRFYQSGKGSFLRRTFYAASRNIVTRSDAGNTQFNYSEIVGGGLSTAISTYGYHPKSRFVSTPTNPHKFIPSDRTLKNTASVWATQFGYDTMTIIVKEFWPDIHRKMSHKPKAEPALSPIPHS